MGNSDLCPSSDLHRTRQLHKQSIGIDGWFLCGSKFLALREIESFGFANLYPISRLFRGRFINEIGSHRLARAIVGA